MAISLANKLTFLSLQDLQDWLKQLFLPLIFPETSTAVPVCALKSPPKNKRYPKTSANQIMYAVIKLIPRSNS